jgi:hypothetical protein
MSKQSGLRTRRRVCAGTPVHYEQTVREDEEPASICGYTGTECVQYGQAGCGPAVESAGRRRFDGGDEGHTGRVGLSAGAHTRSDFCST